MFTLCFRHRVTMGPRHCTKRSGGSQQHYHVRGVWGGANWRMPPTQPWGVGDFVERAIQSSGPDGQAGVSKGIRTGQGWSGDRAHQGR